MWQFITAVWQIAVRISDQSYIRSVCVFVRLFYFALTRTYGGFTRLFPVTLYRSGQRMTLYIKERKDLFAVGEVYAELYEAGEYDWSPPVDVSTVVDLGAHFGDTALYYQARWPEATIVAVEPLPENIEKLHRATQSVPGITVVAGAAGPADQETTFHVARTSLGSSLQSREKSVSEVQVTEMTLDTIFSQAGISAPADVIKFDIEGGEFALFAAIDPAQYARAYIGEIHLDFVAGTSVETFQAAFGAFDCTLIPSPAHPGTRYMFRATLRAGA